MLIAPPRVTTPRLQPRVGWAKRMTKDRRHLVAVDLVLVTEDGEPAPWPFPEREDIAYTFDLDGGADFDQWVVHDPAVVLHRFGGSYGPAEFVVTPRKEGERSLWLTITNPWGGLAGAHELKVTVLPADDPGQKDGAGSEAGDAAGPREETLIEAGVAASEVSQETRKDLRVPAVDRGHPVPAAGHVGLTRTEPPSPTRTDPAGPTRRDLAHAGTGYADTADLTGRGAWPPVELGPGRAVPPGPDQESQPVRLAERYSVLGLRRSPSGSLHLGLLPLFEPGDGAGKRVTFTARCAPADEYGTAFAVIAQRPDAPGRRRQLRSVQSVRIPPGSYQITAELLYPFPGHVRFHGLPAMPRDDRRHWSAIMAAVPDRLGDGAGPAHLIAAVEVSGSADVVADRIDAVRRLFSYVAAESESPVCYSVISYGPHAINRVTPEVSAETLAWAVSSDAALDVVDRLARRGAARNGYQGAAQIECVLTELDVRLTGAEGRPVIVTVGVRPAHPAVTSATGIIPCTRRNDWRGRVESLLRRHAGISFGAIHDTGWPDDVWRFLGNDAGVALADFTASEFALSLGLTAGYAQLLPLPLIDGLWLEDAPPG